MQEQYHTTNFYNQPLPKIDKCQIFHNYETAMLAKILKTYINPAIAHTKNVEEPFKAEKEYIKKCQEGVLFDGKRIKVSEPKVSFLIPVYNKAKYLPLALRSVQNQSLRDIEIVCLDDGSTDNSEEVVEKFQKDDPRIVLYKHEKNMGTLTTRAHLGQYANGKYIMWLDPDDAYCSPNAAEMAYEKAEKTGTDIVHFKSLIEEPKGTYFKTRELPTMHGIIKQPQLIDSLFNEKKNMAINTIALWNKLVSRTAYLSAINFLGEKRWKNYICNPDDHLLTFAIFSIAKSYTTLDHIGYLYRPNIDSITHKQYEMSEGEFVNPQKSNYFILSSITVLKFIFELCEDTPKGKAVAVRIFKKLSFTRGIIKNAIAISEHLDKFKDLVKMFLDCEYVSKNDKKYIKKYLHDVEKLVPKKGKK